MFTIALAQLNPTIGAIAENAKKIVTAALQAQARGADLLLTPELALCGYPPKDLLLNPSFVQQLEGELQRLAEKIPPSMAVLVGTVTPHHEAEHQGQKKLWNSAVLIEQGKVKQRFHKCLLPTYDVFDEDRYFASAPKSKYFTYKNVKIGVTICEDLWNDEAFWGQKFYQVNPLTDLIDQGVNLVVNLSASPYSCGKHRLRESLISHSAKRSNVPLIYVNQVGGNDDLIFDGGSFAVNNQGKIIGRSPLFQKDLALLNYDLNKGELIGQKLASLPMAGPEELWQALVLGVGDYLHKCGFSKAILGLSGGIDSSLVAAIAVEALGKENVLGILMPSPYSSDHSVQDALALADNLGIATQTIAIGPIMATYDQALEPLFQGTPFGIAEENLQSRIRGNLLMAIANKFGHLLLSTGNKSEMAVGYCTLYGDMNGGLAAIADVPKTQVFELCRWLNREQTIIPPNVLTKPPSAELKPGQVDADSLPPYDILDGILGRLIEKHQSPQEIINAGFERETVLKICQLVQRSEFKRRQAAPGLKVTDRAFGSGWRMPIAQAFHPQNC
ncbi:NAD+ synthase [Synechocystis sp. FACHB-383]|uniref:NAD+ synthase n=1 Tax=Synechocystis sp. FACHB-383 TaxID=2692864 RepID=UPI001681F534|nr:NAD+ synthase [Synechocystis sp. FACHB-383]MBD2653454.1 NAD+ synthase [Synechocystis sp. FACHB-383]